MPSPQPARPLLKAIGALGFGLAVLGFCLRALMAVFAGEGLATYTTGRGVTVPYVAAFVVVIAAGVVLLVAGVNRLWLLTEPMRMRRAARRGEARRRESRPRR